MTLLAVRKRDVEAAVLDALEHAQHAARARREARGVEGGARPRQGGSREGKFVHCRSAGGSWRERVRTLAGAAGLRCTGTPLSQRRSACQWMRAITPTVNSG